MCISRVGKVLLAEGKMARVEFFDGRVSDGIDVSMLKVKRGCFVEVFGSIALAKLSEREAKKRREAWRELRRAIASAQGAGVR
ncbi:MAG: HypC/HybG/HupF family hydrogenase formation chaperone [Conexivisphaerales archaeon]